VGVLRIVEKTAMKNKRRARHMGPSPSPEANAAILRLARLLGRQIARELYEERLEHEKRMKVPPKSRG
jgi:hypothetical protein